jgi:branched-chain amino acid transport system substrate-binding protein
MSFGYRLMALLSAAVLLGGCANAPWRSVDLRVGVIALLSGTERDRLNGLYMSRSVLLAAEKANLNEGLASGERRIHLTVCIADDHNSPDGALDAARSLISVERVQAIIGPQFSRNAIPVAHLAETQRTVMICPLSTNPETTRGKRFVFRIPFLDTFQGQALARFARNELKAGTAAVLFDVSNQYNQTLAEVFRDTFLQLSGRVTAFETYTSDANLDFRAQLRRVGTACPDVLFLPNLSDDAKNQGVQARRQGIRSTFLGADGWDAVELAGNPSFEGSYTALAWSPDIPGEAARAFRQAYTAAYKEEPESIAATSWDSIGLLIAAVRKTGKSDPESIRDFLGSMDPYPGVTGTISYRGSGDPAKGVVVARLANGAASVYTIFEPEKQ